MRSGAQDFPTSFVLVSRFTDSLSPPASGARRLSQAWTLVQTSHFLSAQLQPFTDVIAQSTRRCGGGVLAIAACRIVAHFTLHLPASAESLRGNFSILLLRFSGPMPAADVVYPETVPRTCVLLSSETRSWEIQVNGS